MKICLIGSTGDNSDTCSGQILRTRILKEYLEQYYGKSNIKIVNTNEYKRNALRISLSIIISLFNCDSFILMLSRNGRRMIYPIMYWYNKLFSKHIFNNVIGGGYAEAISKRPSQIKYSMAFDVNWVQTESMKRQLEKINVRNVEVLPNSKPQEITSKLGNRSFESKNKYTFCTFSRILKAKGIEDAIKSIEEANKTRKKNDIYLNIYGSVEEGYKERFYQILNEKTADNIKYMGYIAPEKTTETLEKCYALLFPTTWEGEGFPGTVLDGFAAGLPVIATDWNCNADVIQDGFTGRLYGVNEKQKLSEYILWAVENENEIDQMRVNCINEIKKYSPDHVMPMIYKKIDEVHKR